MGVQRTFTWCLFDNKNIWFNFTEHTVNLLQNLPLTTILIISNCLLLITSGYSISLIQKSESLTFLLTV
jgi:hypothetical protein